ncbi:MAG TPA: ABC transporter substrate binding protein, partial [Methylomirabilota bacterium]|nr:ABC transporter substrate binding protein [Methylomirabilota bacterium]
FLDFPELSGKWIELLREMVPRLVRITVAWDPATPPNLLRGAEAAARTVGVQLSPVEAPAPDGLAAAFQSATSARSGAMLGGLIAYGPDVPAMFGQAGNAMVKVLSGTSPAEIPIERPARFELIVNRKTVTSLGLTLPPSLIARADRVIE